MSVCEICGADTNKETTYLSIFCENCVRPTRGMVIMAWGFEKIKNFIEEIED